MELEKLFEGMTERYQNMVLFMPLYQLNQAKNLKYKDLDLIEIGFSVLLFILEKMLTDKGNVTKDQLNQFLGQLLKEMYNIQYNHEEINDFRTYIVDEKLRNDGKDFIYEFMDYNQKAKKYIHFKLIDTDNWTYANYAKKEVNLRLTEKGIELLFKTKEVYSEMQISITLLYFKQQLDKGAFSQVLNITKDLMFQIDSQILSIEEYKGKVKQNVLSAFNRKELEDRYQRSYHQTSEEKKQIRDLKESIERVKANYINGVLGKKDRKKYDTILQIDTLLDRAASRHAILLKKKFELLSTLTDSIQLLIENAFSKRFNFHQEVIDNWVEKKVTEEKARQILNPLMPLKVNKVYNPFRAFGPQTIRSKSDEKETKLLEIDEEEGERQERERERLEMEEFHKEKEMMEFILLPLAEKEFYFISDLLKQMRKEDFQAYVQFEEEKKQTFLDVSIKLHQSKHKKFELLSEEELTYDSEENKMIAQMARENDALLAIGEFEMYETDRRYQFLDDTIVSDYVLRKKVD